MSTQLLSIRGTLPFLETHFSCSGKEAKWPMCGTQLSGLQLHIVSLLCYLSKQQKEMIFSPVKMDRLLVLYCYSHNRAHQASVILLLELFSIQAHVISQDLHFLERAFLHKSVEHFVKKMLLFGVL